MPRIISYTPSWLTRPNPGHQVFDNAKAGNLGKEEGPKLESGNVKEDEWIGPNRTLAHRGAEVFVVVRNQIRWADLSLLKEGFEQIEETPSKVPKDTINGHKERGTDDGPEDGSYRILKVMLHEQIRQLSISPNGKLLAIATSHTVHLAILPDSSHLGQLPNNPIKLKTSTIGRTTHVVHQSPIASILWHPCGVSGNCLVTVTADAAVRLWEFNEGNRWASDTPTLAIDLKKLAFATSEQDDIAPDRGRSRAFSSDLAGMDVAAACFGGTGSSNESAWSAMTLWVAMRAGDIYALCPLSPSKWQAPSTMLPSLSTTAVAKAAALQQEGSADAEESRQYQDQYQWIQELDAQEPTSTNGSTKDDVDQIFRRPERPSPVPKIQGPFQLFSEEAEEDTKDHELDFSDIYVVASKIDGESLDAGDDDDSEPEVDEYGLSASLVCLLTRSGRMYVTLDLEGVEGQWLPSKKSSRQLKPKADPYLALLEGLDTFKPNEADESEWPTFSSDVDSRYSLYTTHSKGVFYFSFDPWIQNLEKELQNGDSTGIRFRLDIFRNGPGTLRERLLSFGQDSEITTPSIVPACVALEDSDLGYFLLTTSDSQPQAAILDRPYSALAGDHGPFEDEDPLPDMDALAIGPARSSYQPAPAFYASSSLPSFIDTHVQARHRHLVGQQIRLSPATLDLMTEAHRVLSRETHHLGIAAADLFRRCERLIEELKDQIGRVQECVKRTDDVIENTGGKANTSQLEQRVHTVREKQTELQERHEALKKKLHGAGGRKLSEKEKAWGKELERTEAAIKERGEVDRKDLGDEEEEEEEDEGEYDAEGEAPKAEQQSRSSEAGLLKQRLEEVQLLKDELLTQAKDICTTSDDTETRKGDDTNDDQQLVIPRDLKARKMAQVMALLDRETTMVDAARKRLDKLSLASIA